MGDLDLIALNAPERWVLAMLASGHTAKSIAAETGATVHSVNERLREARRKTGAASSRELARLLLAADDGPQENRDKQIEVAVPVRPDHPAAVPSHRARRVITGFVVMIAVLLAALATIVAHRPPTPVDDPLLADLLHGARASELRTYARVRTERRDPVWAPSTEAALKARFDGVVGRSGRPLRVLCGASLCEVAGTWVADGAGTPVALQDLRLADLPKVEGLVATGFHTALQGRQLLFVAYLSRTRSCANTAGGCGEAG